jgi:peptidoglycan/xylan/chitin deacetylase (PgdA/CDA1 family)
MDDGATAVRNKPSPRAPARVNGSARGRGPLQPIHRRRRATAALALLAALSLIAGLAVGASGGATIHQGSPPPTAYFQRIKTLAGIGPGSFFATERAAESAAIDKTLSYTPYVRIAGNQHREVALTFDDGPGPYTPQVLSSLERENVPGTFFEVGVSDTYFHVSTSLIAARGYPIGDHTENHFAMGKLTPKDQKAQLLEDIATLKKYGAPFPRLFRPPYGSWDNGTLKLLHKYKMLMVLWTVDTSDYERPGVSSIVHAAVSGARPGAIILLHDAGGDRSETVQALPRIIRALRSRGYKFVTIPRLLLDNPPPHDQDISQVIGTGG